MEGKFLKVTFTERIIIDNTLCIEPFYFEGEYYIPDGWQSYLDANNIGHTFINTKYTPPTMSGNLVTIPEKFEWVFRNDRFELNGFVVEFIRTPDNELMVDVAYLRWQAFQEELDKPENATVKNSLEPVWDYVLEIAIQNGWIQ